MSIVSRSELMPINFDVSSYEDTFQEYKSDLQQYIDAFSGNKSDTANYAKQYLLNKLEEKWLPVLGFNASRIGSHITELQAPKKAEVITSLSMRELLAHDDGQSEWLVPNLFSSTGLYILGALPKTGKTILLNLLMYGVAVSGEFLGRPVQTCNVLYIQLEESLKSMKKRAYLAGFGNDSEEETSLVVNFEQRVRIERRFSLTSDLRWLDECIRSFKPRLVIIDSLRKATKDSDVSENTNEFGKLVYGLQDVINFADTCCVAAHHMSKAGSGTDLISKIAGHTSISGASDGIVGLFKEKEDSKVITLCTKPRDGYEMKITYELVRTDKGLWAFKKLWEDTPAGSQYTSKILRFLALNVGTYYTAYSIARELGVDRASRDFNEALEYLDNSEILQKKYGSKGVSYALTEKSLWMVNPKKVKDMVSPFVLDANALMQCKTKRQIRDLIKDWDKTRKEEANALLFREEKLRIRELASSWEFQVGDKVLYKGREYEVVARDENAKLGLNDNPYLLQDMDEFVPESELYAVTPEEEPEPEAPDIELEDFSDDSPLVEEAPSVLEEYIGSIPEDEDEDEYGLED